MGKQRQVSYHIQFGSGFGFSWRVRVLLHYLYKCLLLMRLGEIGRLHREYRLKLNPASASISRYKLTTTKFNISLIHRLLSLTILLYKYLHILTKFASLMFAPKKGQRKAEVLLFHNTWDYKHLQEDIGAIACRVANSHHSGNGCLFEDM